MGSPEAKNIFKKMSESEFIKLLSQSSNNDIEYTQTHFKLKKKYPFTNKETLRIWIIEKGKEGILDDDDLNRNYINIANDIEELIAEGWLRVILT